MSVDYGFGYAIAFLLDQEKGYAEDLGDGAGETNFGITKKSYPDEDIKAMTQERATVLYRRDYYDAIHLGLLPIPFRTAALDCAANQGQPTAVRLLQESLGVPVDGVIGPVTASAARAQPAALEAFMLARLLRYSESKNWPKFKPEWMRRLLACHRYCGGLPS